MADRSKEKRGRANIEAVSQHEADARLVREKMARLRELRLAHEAANSAASAATSAGRIAATPRKARKPREKGPSLSDWLTAQQSQGRRS